MIATAALAAVALCASSAPVFAQVDLRLLRQQNEIRQQQDTARQDALAAQRESAAAQSRYDTQLTLRSLDAAVRPPPTEPTLRPTVAPPPRGPSPEDMAADAERMDRLTDARLAESNARLRDIAPAR
jgi:hypothetical protein